MFKTLIAPVVAASLAFTPMAATPARAGDDDVAKALAGIALLAIIGSAVASDGRAPATVTHPPKYHPPQYHPPKPVTPPRPVLKRKLPAQCREVLRHGGQQRTYYGKACLERTLNRVARLPDNCRTVVNVFGRNRQVYLGSCLRRAGWTT